MAWLSACSSFLTSANFVIQEEIVTARFGAV
jgi:hypothetical protein